MKEKQTNGPSRILKLGVSSILLASLSLIGVFVSVYAWLTLQNTNAFDELHINALSKDIIIEEAFVVNSDNVSHNNDMSIDLREYDPYISANNSETNAIIFAKVTVSQIADLFMRLAPLNVPNDQIAITDVCFMQLYVGDVVEDLDSDLYHSYNTKFADTTLYPKISNFEIDYDTNALGQVFTIRNFDVAFEHAIWIVINIDYSPDKIARYINIDPNASYDLANVNSWHFINNFDILFFGG